MFSNVILIFYEPTLSNILTHLCRTVRSTFAVRETQSLGQQMLNAPFGINGLTKPYFTINVRNEHDKNINIKVKYN